MTGKHYGIITGYDVDFVVENDFLRREMECSPLFYSKNYVEVPCGHCPECLTRKKMNWIGRCLAEKETTANSYFLTLTYNDDNIIELPRIEEMQHFINRLRKFRKCRYLVVGELGEQSNRAHYHMILFMEKALDDLILQRRGKLPLYRSALLEKCWDEKGFISVGQCTASSIGYTIGYLVSGSKKTVFKSQSQGLGSKYFSKLEDRYSLGTGTGKDLTIGLPRYLKEKYGLKYLYDAKTQSLIWNNKVIKSGLKEEEFRDLSEYLASSKLNKAIL